VLAEAIILIVGKFDLSLESIVGVAPMFAHRIPSCSVVGSLHQKTPRPERQRGVDA
jgi:hypothetical protein